jgi:hypothetical protein
MYLFVVTMILYMPVVILILVSPDFNILGKTADLNSKKLDIFIILTL